jgi:putative two-component system response regulator
MNMPTLSAKQNILFVEDDTRIHKGISRLFTLQQVPWGYSFATGVDEALELMQETEVDGVISDVKMPGRDGFDLLSHLRSTSRWQDLPVVMLTGMDNPGLKSKALDMGATDLLNKPINPEELLARIRSILHIKKCQDTIKMQNSHLDQMVRHRTEMLEATRLDMILRLARAAEFRHEETGNHVIRVGYYSKILAEGLGSDQHFSETIFLTSPLHDIGKIGIPDKILLKKGPLDHVEWEIMKTHCRIGMDLLSQKSLSLHFSTGLDNLISLKPANNLPNPLLRSAAEIAGFHHEHWQGKGYPFGVSGEEIPLAARIVAIADVYDALRSRRTYKFRMKHDDTLTIMRNENGTHFDPGVFDAFERALPLFMEIHHQYGDADPDLSGDQ